MIFPRPCIVYLDEGKKDKIPDEYTLVLKFEDQGEFSYKVPVFKLQSISLQELNDKKLIAFLPFLLLKLRKKMEKIRNKENMEEFTMRMVDQSLELASDKYSRRTGKRKYTIKNRNSNSKKWNKWDEKYNP